MKTSENCITKDTEKKTLNSTGISDLSVESCFVDNTNFLRYCQIIDNSFKSHL